MQLLLILCLLMPQDDHGHNHGHGGHGHDGHGHGQPVQIQPAGEENISEEEQLKKISYIMGYQFGANLKNFEVDVTLDLLFDGLNDAFNGKGKYTEEEMRASMQRFQEKMRRDMQAKRMAEMAKQMEEGKAWLEENKKKEGVVSLESGLQYKVLATGSGKTPGLEDRVKVNYKGTRTDGFVFDDSSKRGKPMTMKIKNVIAGWTEALQLMKEGDKWELYVPSNLGYGARGAGRDIPPNAVLIFEIELVEVLPNEQAKLKEQPPVTQ